MFFYIFLIGILCSAWPFFLHCTSSTYHFRGPEMQVTAVMKTILLHKRRHSTSITTGKIVFRLVVTAANSWLQIPAFEYLRNLFRMVTAGLKSTPQMKSLGSCEASRQSRAQWSIDSEVSMSGQEMGTTAPFSVHLLQADLANEDLFRGGDESDIQCGQGLCFCRETLLRWSSVTCLQAEGAYMSRCYY